MTKDWQQKQNAGKKKKDDAEPQTQQVTLEMNKADYFWLLLSLLFFGMATIVFKEISEARTQLMDPTRFKPSWFKNQNGQEVISQEELKVLFDNYRWPQYHDLWIPIAAAVVIGIVQSIFINLMKNTMWNICKEKENQKLRKEKSYKSTEALFKGCYFAVTVTVATIILQQGTFLPKILFPLNPETSQENMYENYPLVPYGEKIRIFFIGSLGYHILKTFEQATAKIKRSDHIEMMLHHGLTVVLMVGSYLLNLCEMGTLVIYIHDMADIWGHLGKCFSDTHFTNIKYFNAVTMWVGWLYSRLIVLPIIAYVSITLPDSKPFAEEYIGSKEQWLNQILTIFLFFLFLLNIWWFYLITYMIYTFATKGTSEDIQNKIQHKATKVE